jgi:hypothetical protein
LVWKDPIDEEGKGASAHRAMADDGFFGLSRRALALGWGREARGVTEECHARAIWGEGGAVRKGCKGGSGGLFCGRWERKEGVCLCVPHGEERGRGPVARAQAGGLAVDSSAGAAGASDSWWCGM